MSDEHNQDDLLPQNLAGEDASNGERHDKDSLVTAYALGELNEAERAEIEIRLRESAEDRLACEELSRLGKLLRKVHEESPLSDRSPGLREAVLAASAGSPTGSPLRLSERFPRRRFWLPLSLAASLAIICGTLVALTKTKHSERAVAQRDSNTVLSRAADGVSDLSDSIGEIDESQSTSAPGRPKGGSSALLTLSEEAETKGEQTARPADPAGTYGYSPVDAPLSAEEMSSFAAPVPQADAQLGRMGAAGGSSQTSRSHSGRGFGLGGMGGGGPRAQTRGGLQGREGNVNDRLEDGFLVGGRGLPAGEANAAQGAPRAPVDRYGAKALPAGPVTEPAQRLSGEKKARSGMAGAGMNREASAQRAGESELADGERQRSTMFFFEVMPEARAGYGSFSPPNTESYSPLVENPFRKPTEHPLSTFSVDVDTASYTNVRRFLSSRAMPPADAVRVEELINYFQYRYPQPEGDVPFSITTDVADCPWNAEHRLLRVGLKGREIPADERPASNLVFLLDVSGSMDAPNKLPLVKEAMYLLTDKLTENDRVAIVVYAGNSGLMLPPTNGTNKAAIRACIAQLVAGGSTNGGQGLQMAYDTAQSQFIKGGTNRVILATDGDFNVGVVDQNDLVRLIEQKAKSGVFLSALGFGVGNLKDGTLEKLADKGNGNYAYIDTLGEARRVLVEQLSGTLVTIAQDVKLQIEFNPAQAAEYRLIGYENRVMPHQDFNDDRKDAGEIGAGHTVTALYEIVPAARGAGPGGEPLKYQRTDQLTPAADADELATIKLRYKEPEGAESRLIECAISDRRPQQAVASGDFNFVAAVAEFGMLLRESPFRGAASYKSVLALAEEGLANDSNGYRSEFVELVRQARDISGKE